MKKRAYAYYISFYYKNDSGEGVFGCLKEYKERKINSIKSIDDIEKLIAKGLNVKKVVIVSIIPLGRKSWAKVEEEAAYKEVDMQTLFIKLKAKKKDENYENSEDC